MEYIKYPTELIKDTDKLEYAYVAQEKLRLEHNEMGRQFREKEIDEKQWNDYLVKFDEISKKIGGEIAYINDVLGYNTESGALSVDKEALKTSVKYDVDINTVLKV